MSAILNSAILDSAFAILDSDTLLSSLIFTQKHSHSTLTLTQSNSNWLSWWWHAILNSAILNFSIWDSAILVFPLKLTLAEICSQYLHKKTFLTFPTPLFTQINFTLSFSLNLMMAAILNSAILNFSILDSAILHKTLNQTNSIWLKLIHSHSTWWCQPSWILPSWIQTMLSWIQIPCYLLSDSLKNTLTPLCLWLKLIQSAELDDGSLLELCHLGFSHLSISSQTHTCQDWFPPFPQKKLHSHFLPYHLHKKTSLIYSDLTWWWQPSWILPSCIQTQPSWNQTPCYLLSDSLKNTLTPLWLWLILIETD